MSWKVLTKQGRRGKGWTQAQLADAVGVTESTVQSWEQGRRTPEAPHQTKLCAVLGIDPVSLETASAGEISRRGFGKVMAGGLFLLSQAGQIRGAPGDGDEELFSQLPSSAYGRLGSWHEALEYGDSLRKMALHHQAAQAYQQGYQIAAEPAVKALMLARLALVSRALDDWGQARWLTDMALTRLGLEALPPTHAASLTLNQLEQRIPHEIARIAYANIARVRVEIAIAWNDRQNARLIAKTLVNVSDLLDDKAGKAAARYWNARALRISATSLESDSLVSRQIIDKVQLLAARDSYRQARVLHYECGELIMCGVDWLWESEILNLLERDADVERAESVAIDLLHNKPEIANVYLLQARREMREYGPEGAMQALETALTISHTAGGAGAIATMLITEAEALGMSASSASARQQAIKHYIAALSMWPKSLKVPYYDRVKGTVQLRIKDEYPAIDTIWRLVDLGSKPFDSLIPVLGFEEARISELDILLGFRNS